MKTEKFPGLTEGTDYIYTPTYSGYSIEYLTPKAVTFFDKCHEDFMNRLDKIGGPSINRADAKKSFWDRFGFW